MKYVTFLAFTDWSNVLTMHNLCLKNHSSKYKSICVCLKKHYLFDYTVKHEYNLVEGGGAIEHPHHVDDLPHRCVDPYILEHITKSNVIIIACEDPPPDSHVWIRNYPQILNILPSKKIVYFFCCDNYFELYCSHYWDGKERNAFIVPEFNHNNCPIIIPGAPVEIPNTIYKLIDKRYKNDKIVVTHVNSRDDGGVRKGSLIINKIMLDIIKNNKNIKYNFIDFQEKSFKEILEIKKNTDIYIDQYNTNVGGFGTSSIEALTFGCITLCTIGKLNKNLFKIVDKENFPIIDITGDIYDLKKIITTICSFNKETIMEIAKKNIDWMSENLSAKKTCSILEDYLDYYE